MEEIFESEKAFEFILGKFKELKDYDFIKEDNFREMVKRVIELDREYIETSGAEEDGVYDDDEAFEFMQGKMKEEFPEYKMYMMRLVEDYMEYEEEYLESIGAIEWED